MTLDVTDAELYDAADAVLATHNGGLVAALAAAQAEFPTIGKGRTGKIQTKGGGEYSYDYADLADVLAVVRPILARHGIAITQCCSVDDHGTRLTTSLLWRGEALRSTVELATDGLTAQQIGSLRTYMRRYELCAIAGVHPAGEDDDGAAAGDSPARPSKRAAAGRKSAGGGPTGPMIKYIGDLFAKVDLEPTVHLAFTENVTGVAAPAEQLTFEQAQALIDALLEAKRGAWPETWHGPQAGEEPF